MATCKTKLKRSDKSRTRSQATRSSLVSIKTATLPEPVTEKKYITTEPEVEIRKPGTLAQALTEPAVAVAKTKTKVRREIQTTTRRHA